MAGLILTSRTKDSDPVRDCSTLLERLLAQLREGGMRTPAELARELGTSPAMVEAMVAELGRRGYLQALPGDCVGRCQGCPHGAGCAVAGAGQSWSLVETVGGAQRRRR